MPNPTIFPSNLAWLGLGKEGASTYGTPAASPTVWVPLMDPNWKPNQKQLQNEAMYGDMAKLHGVVAGTRSDTIGYKSYLFLDSVFQHCMALLGAADTVTGSADPWTHATSLKNSSTGQPTSWTVWYFNGSECWRMAGAVLGKLDIDIKAEALGEISAEWTGLPATQVTAPSNTPTTLKPWAGWNTTVTVNSVAASNYSDVKVSYKRTLEDVQTADGTQAPFVIFAGPVEGEIDFTGVYQGYTGAPTDLSWLLANTQVPVTIQINPVGDATHFLKLQHTLCAVDSAEIKSAAGKYVEVSAKYLPIANSTDTTDTGLSPAKVTLATTVSTSY